MCDGENRHRYRHPCDQQEHIGQVTQNTHAQPSGIGAPTLHIHTSCGLMITMLKRRVIADEAFAERRDTDSHFVESTIRIDNGSGHSS